MKSLIYKLLPMIESNSCSEITEENPRYNIYCKEGVIYFAPASIKGQKAIAFSLTNTTPYLLDPTKTSISALHGPIDIKDNPACQENIVHQLYSMAFETDPAIVIKNATVYRTDAACFLAGPQETTTRLSDDNVSDTLYAEKETTAMIHHFIEKISADNLSTELAKKQLKILQKVGDLICFMCADERNPIYKYKIPGCKCTTPLCTTCVLNPMNYARQYRDSIVRCFFCQNPLDLRAPTFPSELRELQNPGTLEDLQTRARQHIYEWLYNVP